MGKKHILLFCCMLILSACGSPLNQFTSSNVESYSSATLTYGDGKITRIEDKEKLKEIIRTIKDANLKKSENQEKVKGFKFLITLIGKESTQITIVEDRIKIDDEYYDINNSLSIEKIESLFQ